MMTRGHHIQCLTKRALVALGRQRTNNIGVASASQFHSCALGASNPTTKEGEQYARIPIPPVGLFLSSYQMHQANVLVSNNINQQRRAYHAGSILMDDEEPPTAAKIAADIEKHKAGLSDPDRPTYQNPLHHNNADMQRMFREDFDSDEEFEKNVVKIPPFERPDGTQPPPSNVAALADECLNLTMLEMNELVDKIAAHYGFAESDLEPGDEEGEGGDDGDDDEGDAAGAAPAKTTFDVKLVSFDAGSKIKIIKEVRAMAGLGLKEAKELVEGVPAIIQKDIKMEAAEELKAKLAELGAVVEIV